MTKFSIQEDMSYRDAMQHARQHIADIESLGDDLDLLVQKVEEAKAYLKFCQSKIYEAEATFNDIFAEEE